MLNLRSIWVLLTKSIDFDIIIGESIAFPMCRGNSSFLIPSGGWIEKFGGGIFQRHNERGRE